MSKKQKIMTGPLPKQDIDTAQFEETEILWGRVIIAALVVLALAWATISFLFSGAEDKPAVDLSPGPKVMSMTESRAAPVASEKRSEAEQRAKNDGLELQPEPESMPEQVSEEPAPPANETLGALPEKPALSNVISPVTILHEGIETAELAHWLKDGKPDDTLGYEVAMSDEGIIKVILYTEMNNLRGTKLFHDWYRGDKRMARVKIPVNAAQQNSHSSKFINKQMTGEWTVKVVDEEGELFAQANFVVKVPGS